MTNSETKVEDVASYENTFVYITVQLHRFSLAHFIHWG